VNPKRVVDFAGLGALVLGHREGRGLNLREAATECGVSPSTLSRIERGEARPDLDTIRALVDWVGVPVERIMTGSGDERIVRKGPRSSNSALENVEIQFRADPQLRPEAAEALIRIVREAYKGLSSGTTKGKP
jgi:transcriptional regulator with XRE-family HTH domain